MNVVVTGAAGFVGSHLAERLVRDGASVVGVDRRSPATDAEAAVNLAELSAQPDFRFVRADLCDDDVPLARWLDGASVVFHLAGTPGVRPSWGDSFAAYLRSNVLGTQRVLEACAAAVVPRLVFASSSSVYGPGTGRPSRETDATLPLSPYGVTKLAAERLALAYALRRANPTSVVALRYFTVYGPRQRPDMAIGRVLRAALTGRPMRLYGTGAQRRDFTYVDDVVTATVAAGSAPAQAEVVNVGGGASVTMLDVLAGAAALTGREVPVERDASQPGDVDATAADLTLARHLLGYVPSVAFAEGLERQYAFLSAGVPSRTPA
jgi:UDP-glucuronate 4-epimerase